MRMLPFTVMMLSLLSQTLHAAGTVTVHRTDSSETLNIQDAQRLSDVVTQPALAHSWWPGAVIGVTGKTRDEQARHQQLLSRLAALAAQESGEDAAAIRQLQQQMAALKVTDRQFVDLDPDMLRVSTAANKPLAGDYTLWAGKMSDHVTLYGLVSGAGNRPFTPGKSVAEYLDETALLSGADRSYAWVIYPDGRVQKAPVAYWNKRHVEPMPGSAILIGFSERLFSSAYDDLNAQLVHSLTHRIPQ
ncbi:capsule biosynthesis GfcC family protein [Atlantibacter hermannii]|uniref:capsule biosynthesis GfcC family protein n=1 Tax=Atlantibacter hermannii TaxID=565 RepID=UPI0022B79C77|nr:capsule biosynthesis GfcC family protein [Atlantibacter hermannii]MCZ7833303.1 capsule biosynthesis GfcC family protein [Atlantibacter hermannii]